MGTIKLNVEETAAAMFIFHFMYRADFRKHFRQLIEAIVGEDWEDWYER